MSNKTILVWTEEDRSPLTPEQWEELKKASEKCLIDGDYRPIVDNFPIHLEEVSEEDFALLEGDTLDE